MLLKNCGLAPMEGKGGGWLALFHRGYRLRELALACPHMQQLHDQAQQELANHLIETPPSRD